MTVRQAAEEEKKNLPGYPIYPSGEDIYYKFHEEKDVNPEEISQLKAPIANTKIGKDSDENRADVLSGSDLDIPGSEMDDSMEDIGSEDEENNYYSIGGDDHNNLDENSGV